MAVELETMVAVEEHLVVLVIYLKQDKLVEVVLVEVVLTGL